MAIEHVGWIKSLSGLFEAIFNRLTHLIIRRKPKLYVHFQPSLLPTKHYIEEWPYQLNVESAGRSYIIWYKHLHLVAERSTVQLLELLVVFHIVVALDVEVLFIHGLATEFEGSMRYAHTLLFVCLDCNLPVSVSRVTYHKDLEHMESMLVRIKCDYCANAFEVRGYTAQMHWVTEWESSAELDRRQATTSK